MFVSFKYFFLNDKYFTNIIVLDNLKFPIVYLVSYFVCAYTHEACGSMPLYRGQRRLTGVVLPHLPPKFFETVSQ